MNLDELSRDAIAQRIGAELRVVGRDTVVTLEEVSPRVVSGPWESFSLVLRGPVGDPLPQTTYGLEDPDLGTLELFLVPIGRDDRGRTYEAAFNRGARDRRGVRP